MIKCLASQAFYPFFAKSLMNSLKHDHSLIKLILKRGIKWLASWAFYPFFAKSLMNSLKHDHSCKILHLSWLESLFSGYSWRGYFTDVCSYLASCYTPEWLGGAAQFCCVALTWTTEVTKIKALFHEHLVWLYMYLWIRVQEFNSYLPYLP